MIAACVQLHEELNLTVVRSCICSCIYTFIIPCLSHFTIYILFPLCILDVLHILLSGGAYGEQKTIHRHLNNYSPIVSVEELYKTAYCDVRNYIGLYNNTMYGYETGCGFNKKGFISK